VIQRLSSFVKLAALAAAPAILASPSARAGFDAYLYSAGHADIQVGYENGELTMFYELSGSAKVNGATLSTEMDAAPTDVSVVIPETALVTGDGRLPSPFAGDPLYLIKDTSQGIATQPYLGFGAEDIDPGVFANDALTVTLTGFASSVTGGQAILYGSGFWASPNMNTADGVSATDSITVYSLGHDHYNFGFTAAGTYDLTFTATGTLADGGATLTVTDTFHFVVGDQPAAVPEPTSLALSGLALGCAALVAARRRSV